VADLLFVKKISDFRRVNPISVAVPVAVDSGGHAVMMIDRVLAVYHRPVAHHTVAVNNFTGNRIVSAVESIVYQAAILTIAIILSAIRFH